MTDDPQQPQQPRRPARSPGPRTLPFDDDPAPEPPGPPEPTRPAERPPSREAHAAIADDRDHRLDPRWITASRLAGVVWAAVLSFMALVPSVITPLISGFGALGWLVTLGLWGAFAAGLFVLTLTWPALRYRYASYRVNERGIQIRSGVLVRSVVSVPRSRVQHTDVSRGPIERNYGLATLIVHTAGTEHASVSLGGLPEATADAIRDYLIDVGDDDAV